MTTDTDALLATVREAHIHREHGGRLNFIQQCSTCAALHSLAAELERLRSVDSEISDLLLDYDATQAELERLRKVQRGTALESDERGAALNEARAELERVKAERDTEHRSVGRLEEWYDEARNQREDTQARLDKALSALREISGKLMLDPGPERVEQIRAIARAAIAEIEGEA